MSPTVSEIEQSDSVGQDDGDDSERSFAVVLGRSTTPDVCVISSCAAAVRVDATQEAWIVKSHTSNDKLQTLRFEESFILSWCGQQTIVRVQQSPDSYNMQETLQRVVVIGKCQQNLFSTNCKMKSKQSSFDEEQRWHEQSLQPISTSSWTFRPFMERTLSHWVRAPPVGEKLLFFHQSTIFSSAAIKLLVVAISFFLGTACSLMCNTFWSSKLSSKTTAYFLTSSPTSWLPSGFCMNSVRWLNNYSVCQVINMRNIFFDLTVTCAFPFHTGGFSFRVIDMTTHN